MTQSIRTLIVVASIVCAILSLIVAETGDEILFTAAGWLAAAVASFAAAHLP